MELIFLAIAIKDQIGYVSDFERNGLFEVNIETGESRYICLFPNEKTTLAGLHCHGEWIGNKVYFIPAAGNYLSVYHTDERNRVDRTAGWIQNTKRQLQAKSEICKGPAVRRLFVAHTCHISRDSEA